MLVGERRLREVRRDSSVDAYYLRLSSSPTPAWWDCSDPEDLSPSALARRTGAHLARWFATRTAAQGTPRGNAMMPSRATCGIVAYGSLLPYPRG